MNDALCGWTTARAPGGDPAPTAGAMLGLPPGQRPNIEHSGQAVVAAGPGASVARDAAGRIAAIGGRPRWRDPDLAARARADGHAAALLAAWARSGEAALERLAGDFTLAVADDGRLWLAVDRIGVRRCYYSTDGPGTVFATTLAGVRRHPGIDARVDPQAIYDYVYFHCIPSPRTIDAGIAKLRPAELLAVHGSGRSARTWWLPGPEPRCPADEEALSAELHAVMRQAVADHCGDGRPGAFLSGGLDSSTVAGYLRQVLGPSARTFSIGFDEPQYDESAYARISARHFGTEHTEYHVTPADVCEAVPRIAAHYDEPFGNSSAVPVYWCAKVARDAGVTHLLAGDGGDELFAGNDRYATQQLFEAWWRLPGLARSAIAAPWRLVPALRQAPLVRKGWRYIEQAEIRLPDRLQRYNFLHTFDPAAVFEDGFLATVDREAPLRVWRERWNECDAGAVNRMLYLDWKFTLADNDLVKVNQMCALAGMDVSYPMLDDELVAMSWRVPANLKLKGLRLRHFYRQAMRGFLAPETLAKTKHGFGLPFGAWLRRDGRLSEMAGDSLSALARRGWFRPQFLQDAQRLHREGTARYYGELVWILMMLELWARAHTDRPE